MNQDAFTIVSEWLLREQGVEVEYWGQFDPLPKSDWRYEVANNDTILGYWEWVAARVMQSTRTSRAKRG